MAWVLYEDLHHLCAIVVDTRVELLASPVEGADRMDKIEAYPFNSAATEVTGPVLMS